MLKRILLWLAIVFTVFYILTAPADTANAVQGAWNALVAAGRQFITFLTIFRVTIDSWPTWSRVPAPRGEQYLLPGEVAVVIVPRHWIIVAGPRPVGNRRAACRRHSHRVVQCRPAHQSYVWLTAMAVLAWTTYRFLAWYVERFMVTDRRLVLVSGLINRKVAVIPLRKVTDMTYRRTGVGRLLGAASSSSSPRPKIRRCARSTTCPARTRCTSGSPSAVLPARGRSDRGEHAASAQSAAAGTSACCRREASPVPGGGPDGREPTTQPIPRRSPRRAARSSAGTGPPKPSLPTLGASIT